MPIFLHQGSYTSASIAAMVKKPEDRSVEVRKLVENLGGKLVGFWLSFGEHDYVAILEFPDAKAAAACAMEVAASGGVQNAKTTPLLTWAEGMDAMRHAGKLNFRPPTKAGK